MKRNVHITIDGDVHDAIKEKTKNLSEWVETKMREELGKTSYAYVQPPIISKLEKFYKNILIPKYNFQISLTDLDKEIKSFFGIDSRTLRKYKPLLFEYNYLTQSKFTGIFLIKRPYKLEEKKPEENKGIEKEMQDIFNAKVVFRNGKKEE
jgi:hypothetical protein